MKKEMDEHHEKMLKKLVKFQEKVNDSRISSQSKNTAFFDRLGPVNQEKMLDRLREKITESGLQDD